MLIQGSLVALVTPMTPEGAVDWDAYERLIEWHIASGTDGIVTMGTTGESPTLDIAEHNEVVAFTVKKVAGRVPVIAGTGGNSTAEAIELTQHARDVGADVSLQVVPYYNKPTQEGLYQHFKAIAEAVNMPMWLYNVPGRTVADLKNDTVLRLAQIPNIVGLKDATGDIARAIDLLRRLPEVVGEFGFGLDARGRHGRDFGDGQPHAARNARNGFGRRGRQRCRGSSHQQPTHAFAPEAFLRTQSCGAEVGALPHGTYWFGDSSAAHAAF